MPNDVQFSRGSSREKAVGSAALRRRPGREDGVDRRARGEFAEAKREEAPGGQPGRPARRDVGHSVDRRTGSVTTRAWRRYNLSPSSLIVTTDRERAGPHGDQRTLDVPLSDQL
jgi:hypothetical protein